MFEDITGKEIKEQFKTNKKLLISTLIVGGLIVIAIGYFAFMQFMWNPANEKSKEKGWAGLNYASVDSTEMAIDELLPVIKNFDGKVGGEVSQFVLARQYMNKAGNYSKNGNIDSATIFFEFALVELKSVNVEDTYVAAMSVGLQADCYSDMEKYDEAAKLYLKAADVNENEMTSPSYLFKAGLCAEEIKDFKTATDCYQRISDDYPAYASQKAIDKYIARASNKIVK